MGYYTHHHVSVDNEELRDEILDRLVKVSGYSRGSLEGIQSCKWYAMERDVIKVSREYPDVLFTVKGEGEEPGDLWIRYFRNGKMQHCPGKIVYDEFDEAKLEEVR